MKKIMIITLLMLMAMGAPALAGTCSRGSSTSKKCIASGCDRNRAGNSFYCDNHKCAQHGCTNKRQSGGIYCATHQSRYNKKVRNSSGSWHSKGSSGSGNSKSGRRSGLGKSSFDPDDHDIESYYDDNRDEYDDFDDAYDGFLDDDDAWDDY